MKQLLPSEFRRGYTPERVVICEVEKRKVQAIIETCKDFPQYHMENYDHLKRVRKSPDNEETLELILCLEKDLPVFNGDELRSKGVVDIKIKEVPRYGPLTKVCLLYYACLKP
eukprot:TRINITY_DN2055_c0_g1_i7.p4 TRINITY_DN2055_c0_g1~~TRINITY_DN2055_c0_g1_i7.p4  ORF type:complete len:113 (+),score=4.63 TRINITY_DN2055_c0_g1_i7:64-402(+)